MAAARAEGRSRAAPRYDALRRDPPRAAAETGGPRPEDAAPPRPRRRRRAGRGFRAAPSRPRSPPAHRVAGSRSPRTAARGSRHRRGTARLGAAHHAHRDLPDARGRTHAGARVAGPRVERAPGRHDRARVRESELGQHFVRPRRTRRERHYRRAEAARATGAGAVQCVERADRVVAEAVSAEAFERHVVGAVAGDLVSGLREIAHQLGHARGHVADGEERAARAVAIEHVEVARDVRRDPRRVARAVGNHRTHVLQVDAEQVGARRHCESHGSTGLP